MKRALIKDSIKEIKNTYKRFISILLMAFLGVGFFAGIRATSPDMTNTIDKYYKNQNVYDIEVISTLGLTNEDVQKIQGLDQIESVYGTYSTDGEVTVENSELVTKLICIEEINKPILLSGEYPKNNKECLVEEKFLKSTGKKIGDEVEIIVEKVANDDGEEKDLLKENKLKIVGIAKSPLYISADRGTSKLGSGKIDNYIYISKDNINLDNIYTEIYIKLDSSNTYTTGTDKYEDYVKKVKNEIESIKEERQTARYNKLITKAEEKLTDAENEFNEQKQNAEEQINEAEQELQNGKNEIANAKNEIQNNRKKADKEFADAEKQIKNAKSEISKNEEELQAKEQEANIQTQNAQKLKKEKQQELENLEKTLQELNTEYKQVLQKLDDTTLEETQKQVLEKTKTQLEESIKECENGKILLTGAISQIENEIQKGKSDIQSAKAQIQSYKNEIEKNETQLAKTKKTTYSKINSAEQQLSNQEQKITDGENELQEKKAEFEGKIKEAEDKLIDAREKISEIEHPIWYILDRNSNAGYNSFIQDTNSIENVGKVFPVVFFIIATLISLNSMTRMVEEQRQQIGTLKALGYNKLQIANKYIIYASLACVIGGILGMIVGFILLPQIIWIMYSMMYSLGKISISFNAFYGILGLALASICILGATIYVIMKELKSTPAKLMRPKSPKKGKRVLLEKIPFIWSKLTFTRKVTVRNLFRYKKRFLMTIIGILGCTALILAGFGLKDSILAIVPNQFEKTFNYDMQINMKSGLSEEHKQNLINELRNEDEIEEVTELYMASAKIIYNGKEENVQMIVPQSAESIDDFVNIIDVDTRRSGGII